MLEGILEVQKGTSDHTQLQIYCKYLSEQ